MFDLLLTYDLEMIAKSINLASAGLGLIEGTAASIAEIFALIAGVFGIGVGALAAIIGIISFVFALLVGFVSYLLPAIALFKMGRKAGYKYAWFAFIPFLQTYLEFVLPRREFKALFIKTYKRDVMGIVFLLLSLFGTALIAFLNGLVGLGQILDIAFAVFMIACNWRKMYDLLYTFGDEEKAKIISIIGLFFPFVYSIVLILSMGKTPEYGAKNFYNVKMSGDNTVGVGDSLPNDGNQ